MTLVVPLVCLMVLGECQPGRSDAKLRSNNLQSIFAHVLPPHIDAERVSRREASSELIINLQGTIKCQSGKLCKEVEGIGTHH